MHNSVVTRRAVLIGCPGNPTGVKEDLFNMQSYLFSEQGGHWYDDEIDILINPSLDRLFTTIHSAIADYVLIYFSGQAYTDRAGNRMLRLHDTDVSETFLLNTSRKQLVIIDAGRGYAAPGFQCGPELNHNTRPYPGSEARDIFDDFIADSQPGKVIIHSASRDQKVWSSVEGSYFTSALLYISSRIQTQENYSYASIFKILGSMPRVLQREGNDQIPEISYKSGMLTVPFALGVPGRKDNRETPRKSDAAWAGLSLLTLLFLGMSNKG
jgi:hypothetical protein